MNEYRLKIAVFEGRGSLWSKISGTGASLPTILHVTKLDASIFLVVLEYGHEFLSLCHIDAFYRQTDVGLQTFRSWLKRARDPT